jgi:hypothetical protein
MHVALFALAGAVQVLVQRMTNKRLILKETSRQTRKPPVSEKGET